MNKKMLLTSLACFIANFLGGWLIYGTLLKNTMAGNMPEAVKPLMTDPPNMPPLIAGHLVMGILAAWILIRTSSNSVMKGITTMAIVNGLMTLGMNCIWSSMMSMYNNVTSGILTDVGGSIALGVIIGAAGGWVLGRGNTAS